MNGERHETGFGVHDDADSFACRCELEGIAQQVPQYRVHAGSVHPYGRVLGVVDDLEVDMFLCCFFLEVRTRVFHQFAQQRRLYFEFHLLVLHLAEFEQLVHHAKHTLTVAVYDLQLTANALTDALRLEDVLYRTHDERERRTQLMTDVGEKAQLDIRHLLLHFHALPQTVIDGYRVYRQSDE